MPLELALLPVVESAFEPYAYSRARAAGLWQFIPGTGARFGLKQNWWYDGRRDVVESTRAALDYLQSLHDEFDGDWLLAIAAYNCGEARVARAVDKNRAAGKPIDFWNLRLPAETRAYVPKLLAMRASWPTRKTYGLASARIPNEPYFARVRHERPDRPEGGRRDRRHHARGTVRAEPGVPSLGHRPERARTPAAADRRRGRCSSRTSRSSPPSSACGVTHYTVQRGRHGGVGRQAVQHHDRRHPRAERPAERRRSPSAPTCACRRQSSMLPAEGDAGRRACRRPRGAAPRGRAARARGAPRRFAVDHRAPPRHERGHARHAERHAPGDTLRAGQKLQLTAATPALVRTRSLPRRPRQCAPRHLHGARGRHAVGHRAPVPGHVSQLIGWNGMTLQLAITAGPEAARHVRRG